MLQAIRSLSFIALTMAFFFCYILPNILAWLCVQVAMYIYPGPEYSLGWVGLFTIWAMLLSPFAAGYMAAALAKRVPLLHGLAVSLVASVMYIALLFNSIGAWFPLVMLFLILSGISGAWFWRYRTSRQSSL